METLKIPSIGGFRGFGFIFNKECNFWTDCNQMKKSGMFKIYPFDGKTQPPPKALATRPFAFSTLNLAEVPSNSNSYSCYAVQSAHSMINKAHSHTFFFCLAKAKISNKKSRVSVTLRSTVVLSSAETTCTVDFSIFTSRVIYINGYSRISTNYPSF